MKTVNYILSSLVGILFMAGSVTSVTTSAALKKQLMKMSKFGDVRRTGDIQEVTRGDQGKYKRMLSTMRI